MRYLRTLVLAGLTGAFAASLPAAHDLARSTGPVPKTVSLKLETTTTARALAELSRQTGIAIEDRINDSVPAFSLELPKTTFWPALDAVARASQARVELYARDGRLALVRRPAGYTEPPVSYSGPFRTTVKRVSAARNLETGIATYTATLEVAWEPTLQPLYLDTSPRGLIVRDDQGRDLAARDEGSAAEAVDGRLAQEFPVPLPTVPRTSARLALLKGTLYAVAPNKVLTFAFGSLDRLAEAPKGSMPLRKEADGVRCQLTKIGLDADRWTVQVALEYPPGGVTLESYQSRVVNNELVLESKDGKRRLTPSGYVVESAGAGKAVISYHFLDGDKGPRGRASVWKVVYCTPAALVEVPLTFSFKDVPLP